MDPVALNAMFFSLLFTSSTSEKINECLYISSTTNPLKNSKQTVSLFTIQCWKNLINVLVECLPPRWKAQHTGKGSFNKTFSYPSLSFQLWLT
uniref:Uncharacterized protein n=1 Tax=Rhizophora mucronata TaxID=61149 RepID=A0A2P2L918_RHIMU